MAKRTRESQAARADARRRHGLGRTRESLEERAAAAARHRLGIEHRKRLRRLRSCEKWLAEEEWYVDHLTERIRRLAMTLRVWEVRLRRREAWRYVGLSEAEADAALARVVEVDQRGDQAELRRLRRMRDAARARRNAERGRVGTARRRLVESGKMLYPDLY